MAETDPALRELIVQVLSEAGYDIVRAGTAVELEAALRGRLLLVGPSPLAVLGVSLAAACSTMLAAAVRQRLATGAGDVRCILTFETGTLATVTKPNLGPCRPVAIFEKPLDIDALREVAVASVQT